jgi:succinate dehydrogenase / fumarate reductase flavoprotein subunit
LRATFGLASKGLKTVCLTKVFPTRSHTVAAQGGISAALGNMGEDDWRYHYFDTIKGSDWLGDQDAIEYMCKEAPAAIIELEHYGVPFSRTEDGKIYQRPFGGMTTKYGEGPAAQRTCAAADRTGHAMLHTLYQQSLAHDARFMIEYFALDLIWDSEGACCGVLALDMAEGTLHLFRGQGVVLATGGYGRAYFSATSAHTCTGDGGGLMLRSGLALQDMEFVQFHPTGMVWPPSVQGILVTEGVRGEGGVLLNNKGERFMFKDIPENYRPQTADTPEEGWRYVLGDKEARRPPELLTRDHVARCIMREVRDGRGSPHGGVFLDIAWIKEKLPNAAEHIKKKLPSMYHQFKELAGIDITTTPMEIGPTTHYIMGGIRVDGDSQMSTVPGLFAAGESAAGLHGANRLGGNSLSDLLVFGKRAGDHAARFAKDNAALTPDPGEVDEAARAALTPFDRAGGENPYAVQHDLQAMMQDLVGIVRREDEMQRAIDEIAKLRVRAARAGAAGNREFNPGWHTALDLDNLLTVSEAIVLSAVSRKESRGGHFREDYPEKQAGFGAFNITVRRGRDGGMELEPAQIPALPPELKSIIEETT